MGKAPNNRNKGKSGHKLSHKAARRTKSALAPPDMMWKAFHLHTVEVRVQNCASVWGCQRTRLAGAVTFARPL